MSTTVNILSLVLDDDRDILEIIEDLLKQHGIENYKLFTNDKEFFNHLTDNIHLCVLDHYLTGGLTGLEVCAKIKHQSEHSFVIVMTGQSSIEILIEYLNSCADKYIDKSKDDYLELLIKYMNEGLEVAKRRLEEVEILKEKRKELKKRRTNGTELDTGNH